MNDIGNNILTQKKTDGKIENYLDIGCNNGLITVEFGKYLGLQPNNIYGIDVASFTEQIIEPIPGFVYKQYDGYHIPCPDNFFDIITCSMVLHHVEHFEILLKEINRVLKPNGLFFIKEHYCYSIYIEWLILLEHVLYDIIDYGVTYEEIMKTYHQYLLPKNDLVKIFDDNGFKLIGLSNDNFIKKNHYHNPTKYYYSLFYKKN